MVDLCTECTKRALCSTLCPEAELYVKQDEVSQRELTIGDIRYGRWPESPEKSIFTEKERQVIPLLLDGKTRKQIGKLLDMTRETLRKHIENIRRKREGNKPLISGKNL
jgi:DNA-binding NarL/FixJ family response regulator